MMSKRLVAPAALFLFALGACTVTLLGDLEVNWTVEGGTSSAVCEAYGIDSWDVAISGPDKMTLNFPCGQWTSDTEFYGVEEGSYDVTIYALDAGDNELAAVSGTIFVDHNNARDGLVIDFLDEDFDAPLTCGDGTCDATSEDCASCPQDCGACAEAVINLYWNVNGTTDGSDTGSSWDTCAEVGAASIVVTIDGVDEVLDCAGGGSMSAAVNVEPGNHTLSAYLVDASGNALTTETASATISATAAAPGTFIADFFWDSFENPLRDSTLGDFLFTTSYEGGLSCSETSPAVVNQVTLLALDGNPVTPAPEVCGPDNSCASADGADFGKCYAPEEVQEMRDVLWGEYQIKLQGTLNSTAGFEICWEEEGPGGSDVVDILVGAGQENPVVDFDLERISTAGACAL